MKLTADQNKLSEALSWVALALPTRTPYPALMGIHVRAYGDAVTLTAYDDLGAHRCQINANVTEPGTALIPGALLRDLVKALGPGKVDLATSPLGVELETAAANYRLGVLSIDDYPPVPDEPEVIGVVDRAGDLSDMLSAIAPAVDDTPETARGGVHIEGTYGHLSLAGVSPSLVIFRAIEWSGTDFRERISPGLFADAVRGFDAESPLAIGCSHGLLSLNDREPGDTEFRTAVMRLYNPAKMEWRKLVRGEIDPNTAVVDAAELTAALRRAALLNPGVIQLSADGPFLTLKGEGALEILDGECDGELSASLNPAYLADAIHAMRGPSGVVRIGTPAEARKPVIVRSEDPGMYGAAVIAPKRDN